MQTQLSRSLLSHLVPVMAMRRAISSTSFLAATSSSSARGSDVSQISCVRQGLRYLSSNHLQRKTLYLLSSSDISSYQSSSNSFSSCSSKSSSSLNRRNFHSSTSLSGPKKKGGGKDDKKGGGGDDEEVAVIELPKVSDYESTMDKRISYLESEFNGLRAGRASTDMFNHLDVAAYGSKMSIAEAGQISLKSPTKLSIVAFDPQLAGAIATAIREGGMNLNPMVEGNAIMVTIPKPSKESRDLLIKTASKYSEKSKQQIREVRKDAMDEIKKLKGSISEDDTRRITKEMDALTEKKLDKVQKLFKDKETELNSA